MLILILCILNRIHAQQPVHFECSQKNESQRRGEYRNFPTVVSLFRLPIYDCWLEQIIRLLNLNMVLIK